ncbi:MAG TPA: SDR family oxidoreductase [Acidisarcina sp.]
MAERLKGKTAIITGASSGIGWASAIALATEGANLVVTARRKDRLEELVAEIQEKGGKAILVAGDAREESTAIETVEAAMETFGRLDILVNNAGRGAYKPIVEFSVEEYDEMMDTNMRSTFVFTRHAVPEMLAQKSGILLTVSSVAGVHGFAREAIYCSTKFAQRGFMQALDNELRPSGIRVGLILPGGVKTEFAIGHGRTEEGVAASAMLDAKDVAEAVLLACVQPEHSRIIEIRMRPMAEPLT